MKKTYLLLPIRCIIFLLIFVIGSLLTGKKTEDISNRWSIAASLVNILTIAIIVFTAKLQSKTYADVINYQKGKTSPKQILAMTGIILLVGMTGMYLAGFICYGVIPYAAPMMIAPIPLWFAVINVLLLPVSTALAEDALYLGCGVNSIKNKYTAIIIPALFFALQHSFIPTLFDLRYFIYRFLSFLPLTIILCINYHKKRNPLPIMVGHAVIDLATSIQILATSASPEFYEKMCSMM